MNISEESIKQISEQLNSQMKKAYFDVLDENINSAKPDYEWISKLYIEIKERLLNLVRKDGKIYKQINEDFDTELFKQMISNEVFNYDSMIKLTNITFEWIEKLQAPIRDATTTELKNKILNSEPNKMIMMFVKEVHKCIDYIYDDMLTYTGTLK